MQSKNEPELRNITSKNNNDMFRVLLPVTNIDDARLLLPFAEIITKERGGQLIVLDVTAIRKGETLSGGTKNSIRFREELSASIKELIKLSPQSRTMVCLPDEIWEEIWDIVINEQIDLLLLGQEIPIGFEKDGFKQIPVFEINDDRLASPPCDMVVLQSKKKFAGEYAWKDVGSILLPSRGGQNASLALRIANAIASVSGAPITLLHVARMSSRKEEEEFHASFRPAIYGLDNIKQTITVKGEIVQSITEEAHNHDLVVMGAPTRTLNSYQSRASLIEEISMGTNATIIIVKQSKEISPPADVGIEFTYKKVERPFTVVVDKWFAENTHHSREFVDLNQLVSMKEDQSLTISLGLPALNEADTVGTVISTLKSALMDEIPLLDEIVLIDSGSIDYTREIAIESGIPVYIHQNILSNYDSYHGKGEALWKSLYILEGDIIVWVDTDIRNIHPRFVYGILGPLLKNPNIQYVKGFYRRPIRQGEKLVAGGGGRVTELTVRPLINLFYPDLSGLVQPLSGEYAGRRSALETVPFFTGYGVETGLLIDILAKYGIGAIAQTDLLQRIHHNQPLPSLSKMSFAIMQVVFSRLEKQIGFDILYEANLSMNLVQYEGTHYYLGSEEIKEYERPPINTLVEYQEKFDHQRRGDD